MIGQLEVEHRMQLEELQHGDVTFPAGDEFEVECDGFVREVGLESGEGFEPHGWGNMTTTTFLADFTRLSKEK